MKRKLLYPIFLFSLGTVAQKNTKLIVGTYTNACESQGIYVFGFDTDTAQLQLQAVSSKTVNPSYVSLSPDGQFLYSVNEDGNQSKISAFYFNHGNGGLDFLGSQEAQGADPCYLINDEHCVIAANYSGGSIAVFRKNKFGAIEAATQVISAEGSGPNRERQEKPHLHMVQFSPDHRFVLANDLGTDVVSVYRYSPESEGKILELVDAAHLKPGTGPRHLAFSKDGMKIYVLGELDGTLTTLDYADGKLSKRSETTILAEGFKGKIGSADIHVSADGRFLYASNRGDANDIAVFDLADANQPRLVQHVPTMGRGPRNFTIDPSGKYLLVGNQQTNNLVIFDRNSDTGKLTYSGKQIPLCAPVCLVFTQQ